MKILLDANLLVRLEQASSVQHGDAISSISNLRALQHIPVIFPQSLFEFWVVATRPIANNGLGLSVADCDLSIEGFLQAFPLLEDPTGVFANWRALAVSHSCKGKVAHDTRYVAAMTLHGIHHLLTFNVGDFARFPGITVINPTDVASPSFVM